MSHSLKQRLRFLFLSPMPSARKTKSVKDRIRKIRYILFGHTPFLGRKRSPGETSKANERRNEEGFFSAFCRGRGLDIGYGGDPLCDNVDGWDFEHGDAQLLTGLEDISYDFVYSSHLLEHLPDCRLALRNWWRILRPGGFLILYVPHRDLYEKRNTLPSQFNDDHKHFFIPDHDDPPDTIGLRPLVESTLDHCEILYCKTCDQGYKSHGPHQQSEGEYSIELVARKNS